MRIVFVIATFYLCIPGLYAQYKGIFTLHEGSKSDTENVIFTSLSEIYNLNYDPDKDDKEALTLFSEDSYYGYSYTVLKSIYRQRFLSRTGILETDSIFIYDYITNNMFSLLVKDANVIAILNPYNNPKEGPFPEYYYMLGFEINKNMLQKFDISYEAFVCIGKSNPLVIGQMKPIV